MEEEEQEKEAPEGEEEEVVNQTIVCAIGAQWSSGNL